MRKARSIGAKAVVVCAFVLSFSLMSKGQQGSAVPARVTQPVELENRITLRGNTHPLARSDFDQGVAPDSLPAERILLVLKRSTQQEAALRKLLDGQQTKSLPYYHMWLTPEQFGEQFGPANADIQAVTDWLTSQGFQGIHVGAGRTVIEFSGTAGTVREAFHTEIHKYVVNGEEHWANASDPQIPAALAPVVAGFASLNNFPKKPMHHGLAAYTKSKATGQVQPLYTFPSTPSIPCSGGTCYALGPADFATIYNVPNWSSFTGGNGQTIAVVGQTNINPQDVDDFRTLFGIKPLSPATNSCPAVATTHPIPLGICVNGPDPGILPPETGDETEADLDVEWSGAVAPAATIDFVVSESTEVTDGVDLSALYIIDNDLASIMTESYGECEGFLGDSGNAFYSNLWEQGAAQGITLLEAAGDEGSAACDVSSVTLEPYAEYGLMVVGNASTPFNVAVGGTDFNDANNWSTYWKSASQQNMTTLSSAISYIPETSWNDTCANTGSLSACSTWVSADGPELTAGGGGESNCVESETVETAEGEELECVSGYSKPSWQTGTGVPSDGVRDVPDLSLFAGDGYANSFYVICEADALASGESSCASGGSGDFLGVGGTSASVQAFGGIMALVNQKYGRQGNANYVLYPLAAKSGASCDSTSAAVTNTSCIFYDVQTGNNSVMCGVGYSDCYSASASSDYGILVNPNATVPQAAWTTTPGYDMATGLGTVNAANLVSNWSSVTFTPTTTTLTMTPPAGYTLSNIPHGTSVNVSVGVSPTSSTGDVSLLGGPSGYNPTCKSTPCSLGIDFATLTNGAVSGTTNMLPGGTYDVTAYYAGDGTHASSTSSPVQVTVAAENSNTFLELATQDCNQNITYVTTGSFAYGNSLSCSGILISQYWLVMSVTNSTGSLNASDPYGVAGACFESPAYQCPTGQQVTVTLNGSALPPTADVGAPSDNTPGTYNLNSQGVAEDQFIQLPVGTDTLLGTYEPHPIPPNNSYNTSTSNPLGITITAAATSTAVTATPSNVASGGSVTLAAVVSTTSLGLAPVGSVTFLNGTTPITGTVAYTYTPGSAAGPASLTATLSTSFTSTATVTAKYSGNVNYSTSTSSAITVTITATPNFSLSASPNPMLPITPGESAGTTVSASSINGFTGTVTIACSLPSNLAYSNCTLSTTTLTPGGAGSQLVVATTAPSAALRPVKPPRWFFPSAGALIASLLLLIPRKNRRVKLAFGLLAFALLAAAFVACGGGGGGGGGTGNSGTAPGSYTITVTGTSGSLTQSVKIPMTVQ